MCMALMARLCQFFAIALLVAAVGSAHAAPSDRTPPNIVIVMADDLGFGDVGANGARKIRTPQIDALARHGVNFTHFYASANVCTPSRAGMLTGRYPIRTGLGYDVLSATDERALPLQEETVGELVRRAGYATKYIGKWHLGRFPEHIPLVHGFDEFYGVPHSNDMPDFALYDGAKKIEQPVEQSTLTQRYTASATEFIARNRDRAFLLVVAHTMPHIPLFASTHFHGTSNAGLYGDVVEELDASVGVIVESLRRHALYNNTLVMVTSDNGPFFEGGTGGLKGGKGSTWEAAYRVPFIVSWPDGRLKRGARDAIAMNIDILPTLADIVGVKPGAANIVGASLLALLRGARRSPHTYLYLFDNENIVAVRSQRWKYLTHAYYRRSLGAFEKFDSLDGFASGYDLLFDARSSGGEEYSYADRHPETVAEMKGVLAAARAQFGVLRTRPADMTFPK